MYTEERNIKINMSSSAKPQANFYTLARATEKLSFPFTAQIIPTNVIEDFRKNVHHKVTFLCQQTMSRNMHIKGRNDETTTLEFSDTDVQYIALHKTMTYHSIDDVLSCRKSDELQYLAVMAKCAFNDEPSDVLDVGDILYLPPASFIAKRRRLKCIAMPGSRKITLPGTLKIELQKCDDVRETKIEKLSDIMFSGHLPCLITFGKNYDGFSGQGYSLARECVLLLEYSFSHIIFGCHKDPTTNEMYLHLFPPNLPLDIEILHGEIPVSQFTNEEILSMYKTLKAFEIPDYSKHIKFPLNDLKADFLTCTDTDSEEDDEYENVLLDGGAGENRDCDVVDDDIYEDLSNTNLRKKSSDEDEEHYVIQYNDEVMKTKMAATNNNIATNKHKNAGEGEFSKCRDPAAGSYEHFKLIKHQDSVSRIQKGYEEVTKEMILANRNNNNKSKISPLFRKNVDDMTQFKGSVRVEQTKKGSDFYERGYEISLVDVDDDDDGDVPVLPVKTKIYPKI